MTGNIITAITDVWSQLSTWMIGVFGDVTELFYSSETGLSLLGFMAIVAVGIGLFTLVMNYIKDFLRLR